MNSVLLLLAVDHPRDSGACPRRLRGSTGLNGRPATAPWRAEGPSPVRVGSCGDESADGHLLAALLCVPEIVLELLLQPALRAASECLREPDGHLGRDPRESSRTLRLVVGEASHDDPFDAGFEPGVTGASVAGPKQTASMACSRKWRRRRLSVSGVSSSSNAESSAARSSSRSARLPVRRKDGAAGASQGA